MTRTTLIAGASALSTWSAMAHEGHGLPGAAHWHASDTLGFVLLAVVVAAAWWLMRRK